MGKAIVAIVGRPNVGKSTLFNRIIGSRLAIVEGMPGVTRDRLYHDADWNGKIFTLVDTGGIDISLNDEITGGVRRQAEIAIKEADAILFVVDARAGLTAVDTEVANILRKTDTPVLLVANKVEQYNKPGLLSDFYALGLGEPIPVSAAEGLNTGDMLDSLVKMLPPEAGEEEEDDNIRIAVIGRPNVGKSSLVNKLLGEERVIVSSIPGTTRDSIDTLFTKDGKNYILVDTAGLRRKSKIDINTEKYSVIRTLRAVDRCDLVFMLIDATEGVTDQDKRIAGYAHEQGRAAVLVVNKWDLIEKDDKTANKFTDTIRKELGFMQYAPVIFLSALTGQRVPKVLDLADRVAENHTFRISTSQLNNLIKEAVQQNPPPSYKTRRLKIYYCNQSGVKPPRFILFVNDKELVHFSYSRYLENQVRDAYGFEGTPLWFSFRSKEKEE